MRADDEPASRGPQYQAGPVSGPAAPDTATRPDFHDRGPARGPLPEAGTSRLARMLRAQAQHHQGRR